MDKFDIQKLRDALPIEGVAERLGLRVVRHRCLCPFHDDHTPSMTFRNGKFKCWSCGASGDVFTLAEKVLGKNFADSCKWLADESNIILTEYKPNEELPPRAFDASRYEPFCARPGWIEHSAQTGLYTKTEAYLNRTR